MRMIEGIEPTALGRLDMGIEREARVPPCDRDAWCIEVIGHAGSCTRQDGHTLYEPPDYGPRKRS